MVSDRNPNLHEIEKAFDAGVASITQDGDTIIDQKKINLNGLPGREITMQSKKGWVMKMRAFINPKEPAMYMVGVAVENGNLDFPETQAFLDSVSIK